MQQVVEMKAAMPLPHSELGVGINAPVIEGAEKLDRGAIIVEGLSTLGHRMKHRLVFEWLDRDVLLMENLFPFDCDELIALSDRLNLWRSATVVGQSGEAYQNKAHRDTDEFTLGGDLHPDLTPFEVGACFALNGAAQVYRSRNEFAMVNHASRFSMLRYEVGQYFHLHVDTINRDDGREACTQMLQEAETALTHGDLARAGAALRQAMAAAGGMLHMGTRLLSFVAFLDDVEEGGELEFTRQGFKIQPKRGRGVLFPSGSTHPHRSLPVTRGTKRSLVAWLHP